jgi:hypothetical protein
LRGLLRAQLIILGGLVVIQGGSQALSQPKSPETIPVEVHVSQTTEARPIWLEVIDKMTWPLIILASVVMFRIPLTGIIKTLGEGGAEFSLGSIKVRLPELERKVETQQGKIDEQSEKIRDLIKFSMSVYIYQMLFDLQKATRTRGHYTYRNDGSMDRNLRYLIDHNYVSEVPHWPKEGEDIAQLVFLTTQGEDVIAMRGNP